MDELVYHKLQQNEERMRRFGPHLAALINFNISLVTQPLLQIATQLQISPIPSNPNYTGKSFQENLSTFLFRPQPANRPFKASQYKTYTSVYIANSLQGYLGFYKGFLMGASHFYISILARTFGTSASDKYFGRDFIKSPHEKIIAGHFYLG